MGHIDLAAPVLHVWYKNSVAGGVHQLLGLSGNEIDKILSFVKYVVVDQMTDDHRDKIMQKIEEVGDAKFKQLDEMFEGEKGSVTGKMAKELEKKFEDNKEALTKELNRDQEYRCRS